MITLKFGGTSMGSARRIIDSAAIMIGRAQQDRISVVVSAVAGISNKLQESIDKAVEGGSAAEFVTTIRTTHETICAEIAQSLANFDAKDVMAQLEPVLAEYDKLLTAVSAFGECPTSVHCRIMGIGEQLSAPIVAAVLKAQNQTVCLLDSRKYIFTNGNQAEGDPDMLRTMQAFARVRDGSVGANARILLFPGFICSYKDGRMGLLGRNGSDFSAALVGVGLGASKVEFWTDVDGIYTADPRVVKDAIMVDEMSYEEAMELSFFGSKVLHPKTLAPLAAKGIEVYSLNSMNPASKGTRIGPQTAESSKVGSVRGISCLKNTALISVSGAGMKGKTGMAARIFAAVSRAGISMLLITQSSSEYTISFCVNQKDARRTQEVLGAEFELELRENIINLIETKENCAIVSIVGDGMKHKRGVAGKFFEALASQDINILSIAQGSSERSISAVINGENGDTAVRVAHRFCFNTAQTIEVFAFGVGNIGGALLDQIRDQQAELLSQGIDIKVVAAASIDGLLMNENGIPLSNWRENLKNNAQPGNVDDILEFVQRTKPLNPIFVDCTASYDLPERYLDILNAGLSIATPNKRANSMSMQFYKDLRATANKMHRRFLYETNVGAGLPVIDTLQNLFKSGDRLTGFYGIMSGSLSYIFGRLDEGAKFSEAVLEAREKRYTEPDPRDDLGGLDVARKALIIAREAGLEIELSDVVINKVFPDTFDDTGSVDEFLKKLPEVDAYFEKKIADLKKEGKVLRMGATIEDGKCSVGMIEVDSNHPLYAIRGGENAFVFHTARYTPIPMTIRGYGAGAGVTAAGVFGDILRTVSWNLETL
ncbi:MAG: bifunctional aspartate kinase/homoserine dehydrogenase I [Treponemataceae bacterium]|nr:bifunctional aspartate kinase/homoserine dehydrogenase I [Treponemataceae bacterium]